MKTWDLEVVSAFLTVFFETGSVHCLILRYSLSNSWMYFSPFHSFKHSQSRWHLRSISHFWSCWHLHLFYLTNIFTFHIVFCPHIATCFLISSSWHIKSCLFRHLHSLFLHQNIPHRPLHFLGSCWHRSLCRVCHSYQKLKPILHCSIVVHDDISMLDNRSNFVNL